MSTYRTRVRINLADAVDDLAPPPPPCFLNRSEWVEYLKAAAASQNGEYKGAPKVIVIVKGEPTFNRDYPYCEDCTQIHSNAMYQQGRCKPNFLKETT